MLILETYGSIIELCSSNLELYSSNLELYSSNLEPYGSNQTCNSTFSDFKVPQNRIFKKPISHSASQKYANSFFHPQKLKNPNFFFRGGTIQFQVGPIQFQFGTTQFHLGTIWFHLKLLVLAIETLIDTRHGCLLPGRFL